MVFGCFCQNQLFGRDLGSELPHNNLSTSDNKLSDAEQLLGLFQNIFLFALHQSSISNHDSHFKLKTMKVPACYNHGYPLRLTKFIKSLIRLNHGYPLPKFIKSLIRLKQTGKLKRQPRLSQSDCLS